MFCLYSRNRKKNVSKVSKALLEFLDIADQSYMRAFAIHSTKVLRNYFSRECSIKISQEVFSKGSRSFGADKFRKTSWSVLGRDSESIEILKSVAYDKIKIASSLSINVETDYKEVWIVYESHGDFVVQDIKKYV